MHRSQNTNKNSSLALIQVHTREQFNFKRNDSNFVRNCLTWGCEDQEIERSNNCQKNIHQTNQSENKHDPRKNVSFASTKAPDTVLTSSGNQEIKTQPRTQQIQRSNTAPKKQLQKGVVQKQNYKKYEKSQTQIEEQKQKAQKRRQKVVNYIQSLIPYSRTLTNSKFQQYFNKSAPQAYGNANTNQPIGGVIYGNNLRSFNVNPHDYQNNPKYYQSHTTALNFAKRTKRNQQKNWIRLQKELSKKLNLNQKNQTLKEGKQVVYVDVNDSNMYQIMKENNQFVKNHRDQIRNAENDYKNSKQEQFQAKIQEFYKNKAETVQSNLERTLNTTYENDRDEAGRVNQQVIYRHTDKNGKTRIGADRHALTCFVDLNFPENDPLYTQQLKNRQPIYQTEVQDRHKHLYRTRCQNYQKGLTNVYPSHYLLPGNEQPEIQKMLLNRGNKIQGKKLN